MCCFFYRASRSLLRQVLKPCIPCDTGVDFRKLRAPPKSTRSKIALWGGTPLFFWLLFGPSGTPLGPHWAPFGPHRAPLGLLWAPFGGPGMPFLLFYAPRDFETPIEVWPRWHPPEDPLRTHLAPQGALWNHRGFPWDPLGSF